MKSYTDLEQSKKLTEILPIESADMWWNFYSVTTDNTIPQIIHLDTPWVGNFNWDNKPNNVPCWSLAALLDIIRKAIGYTLQTTYNKSPKVFIVCELGDKPYSIESSEYDNEVDACYEMILKLHELNLL